MAAKKKTTKKKKAAKSKSARRAASGNTAPRKRAKTKSRTRKAAKKKATRRKRPVRATPAASNRKAGFGRQSGDVQGLSTVQSADSESVDELAEEGNAFEADVVQGIEEAGNKPGREVHTREVPEDDVPGEYLDED